MPTRKATRYIMDTYPIFVILFDSPLIRDRCYSALLRYKTAKQSVFFSKSVKTSVKRGVRVLRARSARASHARRACKARKKTVFLASFSSLALCFQPRSRPFVWLLAHTWIRKNTDCFAVYSVTETAAKYRSSMWLEALYIRYGYCAGANRVQCELS